MLTKELVAASTVPLVLSVLTEGENYGYALIQRVRELSGGKIEWTEGMLYPVLHRLERQGHVEATGVHVAALAGVVAAGQPVGKLDPGRHVAGPVCASLDIRKVAVQRGVIGDQDGFVCVACGGVGHQRFQCGSPTVWAGGRPRH